MLLCLFQMAPLGIQKPLLFYRLNTVDNMLAKAFKYFHRRGFKCFGACGVNHQRAMPTALDAKRYGHGGSYPELPRSFAPWAKDRRCLGILQNLHRAGANADACRALSIWIFLRPAQMQSIQIAHCTPRLRGNPNLLPRTIFRNAYPGEYIGRFVRDGLTNGVQQKLFGRTNPSQRQGRNRIGAQRPILGRKLMLLFLLVGDVEVHAN